MLKLLQRPGSFHIQKKQTSCQTWLWRIIVGIDIKTVYRDHGRFPPISPWLAGFRHINSQQRQKHVFFLNLQSIHQAVRGTHQGKVTTNNYFLVGDDYQPWLVTFSGRASQTFYMFYIVYSTLIYVNRTPMWFCLTHDLLKTVHFLSKNPSPKNPEEWRWILWNPGHKMTKWTASRDRIWTWYTQVRPTNEGIQHLGLHFLTINPCELYEPMDASLWICVWLMWKFLRVRGPPAVGAVEGCASSQMHFGLSKFCCHFRIPQKISHFGIQSFLIPIPISILFCVSILKVCVEKNIFPNGGKYSANLFITRAATTRCSTSK